MKPTNEQTQALYRICYRLTNVIERGWICKSIELVRLDERTGNLYVLAGEDLEFEIEPSGSYKSLEEGV
ncbi:hypothetical protein NIES4074_19020 [Cylindrospermum sp. NIES-4074]|nr:hypothetical protein NIES4074_19020 [Cylindrospermum sp. NIES-4074]